MYSLVRFLEDGKMYIKAEHLENVEDFLTRAKVEYNVFPVSGNEYLIEKVVKEDAE